MNRFYLTLFLGFCLSFSVDAKKINQSEALEQAEVFFNSFGNTRSSSGSGLTIKNFDDNIYIVNNSDNGWVIVSADDRVPNNILGYSKNGFLNTESLPVGISSVIMKFSEGIGRLDQSPAIPYVKTRVAESVEPLLGEITWHQSYPYNSRFPEIEPDVVAPTGCVPNAIGDIMYYYKYPAVGKGSHSYEWNGEILSADFSKSTYQWDLMKPFYDGTESQESVDAVGHFMYDLAIALEANFGYVTSSSLWGEPLVKYFDYDPGIIMISTTKCTREDYENAMREDINSGHPVYIQAYNEYWGGHAFVCDGYDDQGYFHYNMGGDTGGYFLSSATGWDRSPLAFCGIKPNEGNAPGLWAGSEKEFLWKKGNMISCLLRGDVTSNILSDLDLALAVKNSDNGQVSYFVKKSMKQTTFFEIDELNFSDNIEDGNYEIYPVCRINNGEWQKVHFADFAADHILVNVENGVKTYTNTSTGGPLAEGVVLIDGIYYTFQNNEATVTSRNNLYGSYSGDITIPASVVYNEETYPVTKIGMSAFQESKLGKVIIGENIQSIDWYAFRDAIVDKIEYVNEYNLTRLEERAFYECYIDELKIPAGVTAIYFLTYSGTSRVLDLPEGLNFMASSSVVDGPTLKEIYVHWTTEDSLPDYVIDEGNGFGPLEGSFRNVTLHVPEGCIDLYKNHPIWGIFNNITDGLSGIDSVKNDKQNIDIRVENGNIHIDYLPSKEFALVYNIQGGLIGKFQSGDSLSPGKGLYIIKVGIKSIKVIL